MHHKEEVIVHLYDFQKDLWVFFSEYWSLELGIGYSFGFLHWVLLYVVELLRVLDDNVDPDIRLNFFHAMSKCKSWNALDRLLILGEG